MNGKSFDIKRASLVLVVLIGIALAAVYLLKQNGTNVIAGTKSIQLPEKFSNIHTRDEALKRLGEPKTKSVSLKWENKSKEEWQKLEKEASDLEASNSDPYGTAGKDSSYSKLLTIQKSLAHRIKETWTYPEAEGSDNGYTFSFDADGNVVNVTKYSKPHTQGPSVPSGKH